MSIQQKLLTHSAINFYHNDLGIGGRGTVRFCRWVGKAYQVGVEFPNGTGWGTNVRGKLDLLRLAALLDHDQPISPGVAAEPRG